MSSLKDRMMKKTQKRQVQLPNKKEVQESKALLNITDIVIKNKFVEEGLKQEELEFLNEKSLELFSIQANAKLNLGKVFTEVHEKISVDGIYVKWLEYNGFNKMTALRHRNRYKVYSLVKNKECRTQIAVLPQKYIKTILEDEEHVKKLNNEGNIYLETIIAGNNLLPQNNSKKELYEEIEYNNLINSFRLDESKLRSLEEKKKQKVFKILSELQKILGE